MIILKKIKKAYEEKNLIKKINNFIRPYYQGFIIALLNLYPKNISIHSPAVKKNNIEDLSLANAIE